MGGHEPEAGPDASRGRNRINLREIVVSTEDLVPVLPLQASLFIRLTHDPVTAPTLEPIVALPPFVGLQPAFDFVQTRFDERINVTHFRNHPWLDPQFEKRRISEFAKIAGPPPFVVMEPMKVGTPDGGALIPIPIAIEEPPHGLLDLDQFTITIRAGSKIEPPANAFGTDDLQDGREDFAVPAPLGVRGEGKNASPAPLDGFRQCLHDVTSLSEVVSLDDRSPDAAVEVVFFV